MSQAVNQAMPSTDIEAAHIRHMLAEAVDSVQAPDEENGTVAAHYQIAGRFDDGALQAHVKDMIAALSPMPARLARSVQASAAIIGMTMPDMQTPQTQRTHHRCPVYHY